MYFFPANSNCGQVLSAPQRHFFRENFIKVYFSISGGSIETRVQKDFLHKVYANQWQTGEDSVFLRQHQDLKNSVKVDENGNVFLE